MDNSVWPVSDVINTHTALDKRTSRQGRPSTGSRGVKEVGTPSAPTVRPPPPLPCTLAGRGAASLAAQGPRWDSRQGCGAMLCRSLWNVGRPRGQPALTPHLQIEDSSTDRDSLMG